MRIFHRIDDVRISSREIISVLDFFASEVKEFIVAAIPFGFSSNLADRICEYSNCSVYQHGYKHINHEPHGWCDEFPDTQKKDYTRRLIAKGKRRLECLFDREIDGYVPPWNNTGSQTICVLKELGFEWYSAQRNHTMSFHHRKDIDIDITALYEPVIIYKPFSTLLDEVKALSVVQDEIGILYHFRNTSHMVLSEMFEFVREVEAFLEESQLVGV